MNRKNERLYQAKRRAMRTAAACQTDHPIGDCKLATRQYATALHTIYDELYELNVTKNTYRIVYHVEDKYIMPPEAGVLDTGIAAVRDRMVHPGDKARFEKFFCLEELRAFFAGGKSCKIAEFRKLWTDERFHWASLTLFPIGREGEEDERYLCFVMDIEDKRRLEEVERQNDQLKKQQQDDMRYRIVVEQTGTLVFEWNCEQELFYVAPKLMEQFAGRYDGRNLFEIWQEDHVIYDEDLPKFRRFLSRAFMSASCSETTIRFLSKAQTYIWCRMTLTCIMDQYEKAKRVFGTLNDVDEAMRSKQALRYRAEYDALTGICNAGTFYIRAKQEMDAHQGQTYAIIRLDINRFKFINDIYGLDEGDKLLKFVAATLQRYMGSRDVLGRMNSDIFCCCTAYESEASLTALVERLNETIGAYGRGYTAAPSFGICLVDDASVPVSILCDWANLALKTIKGSLIRKWAFYDDHLRAKQLDERGIENEMKSALADGQFLVYLQPKHKIQTGQVIGAEALVRWNHPRDGIRSPLRFIPLFERNGFIIHLDEYVWETVCGLLRRWLDRGYPEIPVSVNVSRIHIYNSGFEEKLLRMQAKYRLPSRLIELELTEGTFIENPEKLYKRMHMLQAKGFKFSMDDFGSGYSSLNMLKNTPVNTIKLDREFLNETAGTQKGQTVIRHMIAMARDLEMQVIAEGVETEQQAAFLCQAGCGVAQGFYFSKPMPAAQFERMVF